MQIKKKISMYEKHIRDSTYGKGCKSKGNSPLNMAAIKHGGDMISSWDSYWAKLRESLF